MKREAMDPFAEKAPPKTPCLYLCDFGYGTMRYDIDRLSFHDNIARDGTYEGMGLASQFDFELIAWVRKVKSFLSWNKRRLP